MITRCAGIFIGLFTLLGAFAQDGDVLQVRAKADELFKQERFAEAMPLYSQLISLDPSDHDLSYRYGTCVLFGGSKEKSVGYLKYSVSNASTPAAAWYWLGRAYHLNYQFKEALEAYGKFKDKADKKELSARPVDALEKQCRNGQHLLSELKDIEVRKKVEVDEDEFFRFYDLSDIGGRIVIMPEELKTNLDKKSRETALIYLPDGDGPIYFSSYGKDGKTGKDIYRTQVLPNGSFATPVKIAGYINTDQDEDFPFLHSDGKTFYFSSKGHNSMGGYDVFRTSYDRNSDAFGSPENMDFAVNTPDDDFLYIVDPEHKEACFASGRSSTQGKLHVYRVSTSQVPLVITVLKGTYTSEIDPADKKAKIIVEDALSREKITEVRTGKDGSYVLALPRSGKFRFLVECGPSGKTHIGTVEVPTSDGPRAYRQELALTRNADLEKLVIRNFFDQPLDGDLIALALDEIKRRASLDVNERPIEQPTGEEQFDVFTRAGFTGEVDKESAVRMAEDDARELRVHAEDLDQGADQAYAIALEAVTVAEEVTQKAEKAASEAILVEDEDLRHRKMGIAADLRDQAEIATAKARIAYRTAQDLESEYMIIDERAREAAELAENIKLTLAQDNGSEAVVHLTELKQRLDQKSRPDQDPDPVIRTERAMLQKEKEAKAALQRANSSRLDVTDLTDRIKRLEQERTRAKNNKRIQEIDRELTQYRQDVVHLQQETEAKFKKLRETEAELLDLRGEYALKKHLATTIPTDPIEIPPQALSALADRIATTDSRSKALHVDERFAAHVEEGSDEVIRTRIFDWGTPITVEEVDDRVATRAVDRSGSGDAQRSGTRTIPIDPRTGERVPEDVDVASVPSTNDNEGAAEDPSGNDAVKTESGSGRIDLPEMTPEQVRNSDDPIPDLPRNTGNQVIDAATERFLLENQLAELEQIRLAEKDPAKRDSLQREHERVSDQLATIDVLMEQAAAEMPADEEIWEQVDLDRVPMVFNRDTKEEELVGQLFSEYYSHKEALEKLTNANDRIDGLHGLELMLSDSLRGEMARQLMVLDLAPEQAERILPRVDRLRQIREIHLELAQQYLLEGEDQVAEVPVKDGLEVLPDPENLAEDPETSPEAEIASEDPDVPADQQVVIGNDDPSTDQSGSIQETADLEPITTAPIDPIMDHFVRIEHDPLKVYHSEIQHRSPEVKEGLERKKIDLQRIDALTLQIDSALATLPNIQRPKEQDKVRKQTDRLIDDRLILRTELGQRSAYLTKEEWRTANDSMRILQRRITTLGLPADEPILLLANAFQNNALKEFDKAGQVRRSADRTQDILVRDSLYRKAYALELQALRELDRSITTQNYLLGGSHEPGEKLSYEEIAAKVLGSTTGDGTEDVVGESGPVEPSTERITEDGATSSTPPAATTAGVEAMIKVAREQAQKFVEQKEQEISSGTIPSTQELARVLAEEPPPMDPRMIEPVADPDLMHKLVTSTLEESVALDRKAMEMADRAKALEDSASTVGRKDRVIVERMALRTRELSDSLRTLSLLKAQEGRQLEVKERQVIQNNMFRHRLVKYYYLDVDEQAIVMQVQDNSRYFQMKARALEQYDASKSAELAATTLGQLAQELRKEANIAEEEARNGRMSAVEASERSRVLIGKADDLTSQSDSLTQLSSRLRDAAKGSEESASKILETMDPKDSSWLKALEARSRRTDDQTAELKPSLPVITGPDPGLDTLSIAAIAPDVPDQKIDQVEDVPITSEDQVIEPDAGKEDPVIGSEIKDPFRTDAEKVDQEIPGERDPVPAQALEELRKDSAAIAKRSSTEAITTPRSGSEPARAGAKVEKPVVGADGKFVMPKELVTDIFELRPAGERSAQPILMNEELPEGIIYKVQIGAFRNQIENDVFSDMTPVMGEDAGNGLTRYTAGLFNSFDQAFIAKDKVRDRGYRDAFVVAYLNGKRISLGEAMRASRGDLANDPTAAPSRENGPQRVFIPEGNGNTIADQVEPKADPTAPTNNDRTGGTTGSIPNPANSANSSGDTSQIVPKPAADVAINMPSVNDPTATSGRTEAITKPQADTKASDPIDRNINGSTADTTGAVRRVTPTTEIQPLPVLTAEEEKQRILKSYPATAEEIIAQFTPVPAAANYYPVTGVAPARPVEMIMGLFFTVQVGVYTKPVALDKLYNITPLVSELTETEKIRYSTGVYTDMESARERRLQIIETGVKDAFITAYLNGKRIPIRDGIMLLEEHGPGVLAKP